jgi:hypothetical protein
VLLSPLDNALAGKHLLACKAVRTTGRRSGQHACREHAKEKESVPALHNSSQGGGEGVYTALQEKREYPGACREVGLRLELGASIGSKRCPSGKGTLAS